MSDPRLRTLAEHEWQRQVIGFAERAGWMCYFIPDAMWRRAFVSKIPQQLGNRGFPDLVLVGHGKVLFRELKRHGGRLSEHQEQWRDALLAAGADWAVWYPTDIDAVIETLYGEDAA